MSSVHRPYLVVYRWIDNNGEEGAAEVRISRDDMSTAVAVAQTDCIEYNDSHKEKRVFDSILSIKYKPWQPRY